MKTQKILVLLILSLISLTFISGCQTLSQFRTGEQETFLKNSGGVPGTATYYAKRFNGRKTASGEIYDSKKLTAAHASLPFGTRLKVVNLSNNKSVIVKINDRPRNHEESFIDLSRQAARRLGMLGQGTAKVLMIVMTENEFPEEERD